MKKGLMIFAIVTFSSIGKIKAQYVSVRLDFPVGTRTVSPSPAPYKGAIWIGPEWRWHHGRYVCVPGYWAKPKHYGAVWVPGRWKHTGRGHKWVPGYWR